LKTQYELYFEKQMIRSICERPCSCEERTELFHEFYNNGRTYYDMLCEALYLYANGEIRGNFYITPAGKPYVSPQPFRWEDEIILADGELPPLIDDLHEQLEYFMQRFAKEKCRAVSTN